MKKMIAIVLCAVMALSLNACGDDYAEVKETPNQQSNSEEIPNPFIVCETIADAEKLAGFPVISLQYIPEGYSQTSIEAVENEMVQIFYENGKDQIIFRQAKGSDDISGDYNEYAERNVINVGDLQVTTRGNDGKVNVATWTDGDYTYAILAGFDETGIDSAVISDLISGIQ